MWSLGRGLVAIQQCFLHIEEKRLADFCAGEKSKMNRRYSKNSLYARSLYAGGRYLFVPKGFDSLTCG